MVLEELALIDEWELALLKEPLTDALKAQPLEENPPVFDHETPPQTVRKRPRGRAPTGKIWDEIIGGWIQDPAHAPAIERAPTPAHVESTPVRKRPRGRPPKNTVWSNDVCMYVESHKRRGRPPKKTPSEGDHLDLKPVKHQTPKPSKAKVLFPKRKTPPRKVKATESPPQFNFV